MQIMWRSGCCFTARVARPGPLSPGRKRSDSRSALNSWCERGDSNPHGFTRQILSLVRLPIPPLSHAHNYTKGKDFFGGVQHGLFGGIEGTYAAGRKNRFGNTKNKTCRDHPYACRKHLNGIGRRYKIGSALAGMTLLASSEAAYCTAFSP